MNLSSTQFRKLGHLERGAEYIRFARKPTYDAGPMYPHFWRQVILIKRDGSKQYDRMPGAKHISKTWKILAENGLTEDYNDSHFDGTPIVCTRISEKGREVYNARRVELLKICFKDRVK